MRTSGVAIALEQAEGFVELNLLEGLPVFIHAARNLGEVAEEVIVAVVGGSMRSFTKAASEYGFDSFRIMDLKHPTDAYSIVSECIKEAKGEVVVTAPANAPLIPIDILSLLTELCERRDAVLLRDAKGEVDWFLAAYRKSSLMSAVERVNTFYEAINELKRVMYISYSTLRDLDPMLLSNIRITRSSEIPLVEKIMLRVRRGVK
ncbi:MAG: hypothetical protein ACUVQ0_05715 [Thermoproteota archaeon]